MIRLREILPAVRVMLWTLLRGACSGSSIGHLIDFPSDARYGCESEGRPCAYHHRA